MKIKKVLAGIVKGHRFQVPESIREMNARVLESHRSSPWFGNVPNQEPMSKNYLDRFEDFEDPDFEIE